MSDPIPPDGSVFVGSYWLDKYQAFIEIANDSRNGKGIQIAFIK